MTRIEQDAVKARGLNFNNEQRQPIMSKKLMCDFVYWVTEHYNRIGNLFHPKKGNEVHNVERLYYYFVYYFNNLK